MDAILSRRSIRKYTDQAVPEEVITELLKAAMSAPSAGNQQPWRFVVIDDRRILDEIMTIHPYSAMLKEAPLVILVCFDKGLELEVVEGLWPQDCSAATENILIAAQAIGLGAVWLGVYALKNMVAEFRKLVGAPDHIIPFSLISIGYPAEQKPPANRYDSSRIYHNRWPETGAGSTGL
ncbi:MAG: nitroreductase family protein [Phycisphaerae bacterium]|nr:nitroreductase family protein [Phycisphaerae bacterium]